MTAEQIRKRLHDQRLAALPYDLSDDRRLSDFDVRLALALARRAQGKGYCRPTNDQLAELLGCSDRTIRRSLKSLVDAERIIIESDPVPPLFDRVLRLNWTQPKPAPEAKLPPHSLTVLRVDNFVQDEPETDPKRPHSGQICPPDKRSGF